LSRRRGGAALSAAQAPRQPSRAARTPIGSRLSRPSRASFGTFDAAHQLPVITRRRVLGSYASHAERPRMMPGGKRRSARHATRPPRTRRAGRPRTQKLAPRLPRMRRAGRPRTPRLTVKEPRTRRATCPRRLIEILGAPRDARFCPLSRAKAGLVRPDRGSRCSKVFKGAVMPLASAFDSWPRRPPPHSHHSSGRGWNTNMRGAERRSTRSQGSAGYCSRRPTGSSGSRYAWLSST